jgi:hypothetical protein
VKLSLYQKPLTFLPDYPFGDPVDVRLVGYVSGVAAPKDAVEAGAAVPAPPLQVRPQARLHHAPPHSYVPQQAVRVQGVLHERQPPWILPVKKYL